MAIPDKFNVAVQEAMIKVDACAESSNTPLTGSERSVAEGAMWALLIVMKERGLI